MAQPGNPSLSAKQSAVSQFSAEFDLERSHTQLGGAKINSLHRVEVYRLSRLPQIVVVLHG